MAFSSETIGRVLASGRNYASTIVGFVGGIGLMSAAQSKGLTESINEMVTGATQIVHGATSAWGILVVAFPIIGAVMAKLASNSAKTVNQAIAVQTAVKDPNTVITTDTKVALLDAAAESVPLAKPIVVNDPGLANLVPSEKVKSAT